MKKLLIILFLGLITLSGCSSNEQKNDINSNTNTSNYNTLKTVTNNTSTNVLSNTNNLPVEISNFSTKIHDKSSSRQNNIQITISKLNGTIIAPKAEFSFCEIVGKATAEKGYEKAKIFDKYGNVTEGYRWR